MENQMDFSGKVVLVTGASRGIGRAIARAFAGQGARIAVHFNRNRAAADETLASLEGSGHTIIAADVSDPGSTSALIDGVVDTMGGLDILVNNAGLFENHPIVKVPFDQWRDAWKRTMETNLFGPANVIYWAVRHMIQAGGGRIVNVSSRGAFRGEPEAPAYGASKAGLNAMSQSLAKALAPHNIYVTAVAPGFVETDMAAGFLSEPRGEEIRKQSPLNRVARPEEVAHVVLFLASARAEFCTGCIVDINGASYLR